MRAVSLLAAATLCLMAVPARAQNANALPQGDGRDIVAVACTQCHTLAPLLALRDGPIGWKRHVYNMVIRGAQLPPQDVDTVLSYLNSNFGPGQNLPPAKPVSLPDGPAKQLVETRCTLCHDLERVTLAKRSKAAWPGIVDNMFERFGLNEPNEARDIAAYLAANYSE